MSQAAAPVAFPSWRDHWAKLDGVAPLLAEADKALRQRAKGNHRLPPNPNFDDTDAVAAVHAMRAWAGGELLKDSSRRPGMLAAYGPIFDRFGPRLCGPAGCFWNKLSSMDRPRAISCLSADWLSSCLECGSTIPFRWTNKVTPVAAEEKRGPARDIKRRAADRHESA
jgi:hypothetical protein